MDRLIQQAQELSQSGQWQAAVDLLSSANQKQKDLQIERQLVEYRIQAHQQMDWPKPDEKWAGQWDVPHADKPGILEVDAQDFDARTLADGILGHGALIVRGFVPEHLTAPLITCIDNTILARETIDSADNSPWNYDSPQITVEPTNLGPGDTAKRAKVKKGSIWVAESPRTMEMLIALYAQLGLREILTEYLAEAPALSVRKWVLRRILPDGAAGGWHQDGRFLGGDFRSVNMWMPLSECGEGARAAGMEIIPNQHRVIHETGTHRAPFKWTVGPGLVDELRQELPLCHPHFNPGDVLFFDHYNLHRTAFGPHLTESRYAVESWFFASSNIPETQVPILF